MTEPSEKFVELATSVGLPLGRLISLSKSSYVARHPQHAVVFNATIATEAGERLWWGDVDLTVDEDAISEIAKRAGFDLFIYHESDSRRGFVNAIDRSNVVATYHSDGTLTLGTRSNFMRTPFGRLIWRAPSGGAPTTSEP